MSNVFKNKLIIVSGICLLSFSTALAQDSEKPVKMSELPAAVKKTVQEQSKGAKIRGLAKEVEAGKTFYEAALLFNGHSKDVLIDADGKVVEVEEQVALSSLPPAVKAEIQKQTGKGKITIVESVTKDNALVFYEAHIKTGGKIKEVKVAPDGKLME